MKEERLRKLALKKERQLAIINLDLKLMDKFRVNKEKISIKDRIRPISDWCKHYAVFFDDLGNNVGKKKLKYSDKTFSWKDRTYNFIPNKSSFVKINSLVNPKKYYLYYINNPMPYLLNDNALPLVDSLTYKQILDADLIKKLNDLPNDSWLKALLKPRNIILILIILAVFYYFSQGGKLT